MKRRALFILLLPALVIVAACTALSSRISRFEEDVDTHPYGGFLGAMFFISAFCVAVGGAELLGAWLS